MNFYEKLEKDPANPNLYREAGLALLKDNRVEEAVEVFSKGLVYNPFDAVMRFWRGASSSAARNTRSPRAT